MMQDHKSLTRRWLSCSGWGKERVSLVCSYKGCQFIRKGQWCAKVNILRLTVRYLNETINRNTRNTEPEIGTDGCSETRQNPRVDGYGSGFGPPRRCGSGFWTVLEPNRTVFPVRTRTAGGFPGPVATTRWTYTNQPLFRPHLLVLRWLGLTIHMSWVRGILSAQYMVKQLSCRIPYIWLQSSVVKLSVLSLATVIILLRTRWVYDRALSLVPGDKNLFIVNWLQISSYSYEVSPIAIVLQHEHITLMTQLALMGVRTR